MNSVHNLKKQSFDIYCTYPFCMYVYNVDTYYIHITDVVLKVNRSLTQAKRYLGNDFKLHSNL